MQQHPALSCCRHQRCKLLLQLQTSKTVLQHIPTLPWFSQHTPSASLTGSTLTFSRSSLVTRVTGSAAIAASRCAFALTSFSAFSKALTLAPSLSNICVNQNSTVVNFIAYFGISKSLQKGTMDPCRQLTATAASASPATACTRQPVGCTT